MTYVIIALAVGAAVATWAAATGRLTVAFADPTAKQAVNDARRRRRITREALALLAETQWGPPAPLFPGASDEADDDAPPLHPDWHPTTTPPPD
jgi:ABC-type uncharacterized transport system auxiliary subunit